MERGNSARRLSRLLCVALLAALLSVGFQVQCRSTSASLPVRTVRWDGRRCGRHLFCISGPGPAVSFRGSQAQPVPSCVATTELVSACCCCTVYAVRRSQNGALLNVALEVPLFLSDNGHS